MGIKIGEVIAVQGTKITLRIFDESSKDTLYYEGEKFKGVSIREYISIKRGFKEIVCIVEGEYLDERKYEENGGKTFYVRKVEAKPIGYFDSNSFYEGIKFLPMIKDEAFLLQESKVSQIYSRDYEDGFVIGKMLKEEIPISLSWKSLFNSHIGIFGNTGSGKSNTLAKLFTVLFSKKSQVIDGKSRFILLDFNGEYTANQLIESNHKITINLNTRTNDGDKFPLSSEEFWDLDTLSILFQATTNTQRPFLNRVLNGRKEFIKVHDSLLNYIKSTFAAVFSAALPRPETLDMLRSIARITGENLISNKLQSINWHGQGKKFFIRETDDWFQSDGVEYESILKPDVDNITLENLDSFDEIVLRANLQLIRDLLNGYVQFEHIQPLLKRIESSLASLRNVLTVSDENEQNPILTVISLRRCNQETKKIIPLLIAKHFYYLHKNSVEHRPNKTMHLIIDEAHNILSQQSSNEHESWKDYRLELFEEIIKEGRKFGMFLTLASQRPADISSTVISQIHNFFIHRLVNDKDLFLLDNTISTLDRLSKHLIPNLSKGSCIVTGTCFELPMVLQVDRLAMEKRPDSEDVNLEELWS